MAQFGLTVPKCRTMLVLAERGTCRVGELSEITSIELPTLSRIVKMMQKDRLVMRRRSTVDERAVEISLTAAGRNLVQRVVPFAHQTEKIMMAGLQESELRVVRSALIKMYDNLHAAKKAKDERNL